MESSVCAPELHGAEVWQLGASTLPQPSRSRSPRLGGAGDALNVHFTALARAEQTLVWRCHKRGGTMTQTLRAKSLPICKQTMDCSACPDVLVTPRRNQSIYSVTELCGISPHKGPLEAVGCGVMTQRAAGRNLRRVPGEQA